MKKITLILTAIMLSVAAFSSGEGVERLDKETVKNMTEEQMAERMIVLEERVLEIQAMDFDNMERSEKRALKKELRYIDKEMKALGNGGIFISTGAIIIILLLIIIF